MNADGKPCRGLATFGMSDDKLAEALRGLTREERLRVLLHVALGWPRLRDRRAPAEPHK